MQYVKALSEADRRGPTAPLTPEQARAFGEANDHHEASHLQK
jgi:hypothetical protein